MPPSQEAGAQTPSDRPELSPEFIAVHKRRRIMDAVAELTAQQGYEATKIADIVRRAGVARKTLYDNFDGKEALFLATFDAAAADLLERMRETCAGSAGTWPQRVRAALETLLGFFAARPALAKVCMIESLAATPVSARRHDEVIEEMIEVVRRAAPDDSGLPDTIAETLVGGVSWVLYQQVRRDETERLLDLLPELSEFFLAPYER